MRAGTVHYLWALLFALASGCGGGAVDAASTDVKRTQLREGDSSSEAYRLEESESPRSDAEQPETGPVVSLSLSKTFRERVARVQFIPVRASHADRQVVRIPEPSADESVPGVLRERLEAGGVWDIAFELRERGESSKRDSSRASRGWRSMALRGTIPAEDEGDEESTEPDYGDPVPFPADRGSWQLTSEPRGGTFDNGDPVPLPADPEEDDSSKREGEREDNGDPVPLPADSTGLGAGTIGETGNEDNGDPVPLPASPTASSSSDEDAGDESDSDVSDPPEPEVFRSERGSYVIFTDVEMAATSHRQVVFEDPDPTE